MIQVPVWKCLPKSWVWLSYWMHLNIAQTLPVWPLPRLPAWFLAASYNCNQGRPPPFSLVYGMHFYPSPFFTQMIGPAWNIPPIHSPGPSRPSDGRLALLPPRSPEGPGQPQIWIWIKQIANQPSIKLWGCLCKLYISAPNSLCPNQVSAWGLGICKLNILGDLDIHTGSRAIFCFLCFFFFFPQHWLFLWLMCLCGRSLCSLGLKRSGFVSLLCSYQLCVARQVSVSGKDGTLPALRLLRLNEMVYVK